MQQQAINIQQPNWLKPIFENIPEDLKSQPWGVWKAEQKLDKDGNPTGKWSKAPRNPLSGRMVGANQPEKFGTYEEAKNAYQSGNYTGVGVLLTGKGIVGIDIDDGPTTLKQNVNLKDWLLSASNEGAYIEHSPSGKGFRLFIRGNIKGSKRKEGALEIYEDTRFLTVTGHQFGNQGGSHD